MLIINQTLLGIVFFAVLISIFCIKKLVKLTNNYNLQNMKAINLYLDKKLVTKLLTICLDQDQVYRLQHLMDEILHYFCLDFIALKIKSNDNIISFKSSAMHRLFPESEVKLLLNQAATIDEEVGSKHIKVEDYRQFIIFKHEHLSMIAVLEAKHNLSAEEQETLGNEIMLLIKIAIYTTISKTQNLYQIAKLN